jgi:hypothetical protein
MVHDQRIGPIAPQEQHVGVAEPPFQQGETFPVAARLNFAYQRRCVWTEDVHVDITAVATVARGAQQWHPLGLHPEIAIQADDLPLDPPALISGFRVSTYDPAPMYGAFCVRIVRNVHRPDFQYARPLAARVISATAVDADAGDGWALTFMVIFRSRRWPSRLNSS